MVNVKDLIYVRLNTPPEKLGSNEYCFLTPTKGGSIKMHWRDAEGVYHEPEIYPPVEIPTPPKNTGESPIYWTTHADYATLESRILAYMSEHENTFLQTVQEGATAHYTTSEPTPPPMLFDPSSTGSPTGRYISYSPAYDMSQFFMPYESYRRNNDTGIS